MKIKCPVHDVALEVTGGVHTVEGKEYLAGCCPICNYTASEVGPIYIPAYILGRALSEIHIHSRLPDPYKPLAEYLIRNQYAICEKTNYWTLLYQGQDKLDQIDMDAALREPKDKLPSPAKPCYHEQAKLSFVCVDDFASGIRAECPVCSEIYFMRIGAARIFPQ